MPLVPFVENLATDGRKNRIRASSGHLDVRLFDSLLQVGGEPSGKIQLFNDPQVNSIVIPIYKNREKRIFEFGDRLNPPH